MIMLLLKVTILMYQAGRMICKSTVSVFVLACAMPFPAEAQSQQIKFGIKGGINSSWITDDIAESESARGVNVAFFTELQFPGRISALLDVGLNQRGFTRVQNETNTAGDFLGDVKATSRLTYLSIAPQLNVHLSKTQWRPYLGAGTRFDFLADREAGEFEFATDTVVDKTVHMMDDFVFGAIFSAGIKNGYEDRFQWKLEVRFDRDITDSIEEIEGLFRSNSIVLLFGISF